MTKTFKMYLDDVKVSRVFGKRPHLGKLSPFFINTEAGMIRVFDRGYEPRPITVAHTIVLNKIEPGLYEVSVNGSIYDKVSLWLLEKCGPSQTSHADVAQDYMKAKSHRGEQSSSDADAWQRVNYKGQIVGGKKGKKKRAPRGPRPRWYGPAKFA